MVLEGCHNVNVTGCQVINARTRGLLVKGGEVIRVSGCTIRGKAGDDGYRAAIEVSEEARAMMVTQNFLHKGKDGDLKMERKSGVAEGNIAM